MKFIKNIAKKLFSSRKMTAVTLGVVTLATVTGVAFAGWTPGRTVFDWNNPDQRKGSMNGPVFNSFVNTPYYGDERAFFDASRTDQATQPNAFKDVLPGVTEGSKEVILRTYVHNNANQETNASGLGVARDAKVRITLPTGTEKALRARSYITWSNPAPGYTGEVTDTAELVDNTDFSISYVPGSARVYNAAHNAAAGGVALPDTIVTSGANLGYDQMNGLFPGCFEYQAMVEIKVRVNVPDLKIEKKVRMPGETEWKESVNAKPGDKVQWLVQVTNTGQVTQDNMTAYDRLPEHVTYVPDTAKWYSSANNGTPYNIDQFVTNNGGSGYDFGSYVANGGGFLVRFDTTVEGDFDECTTTLKNIASAYSKQSPNRKTDDAIVIVTKENCQETPVYRCDALTVNPIGDRKYSFAVRYTAQNGATFKNIKYTFGDNSTPLLTDKTTVEHTYAQDGQYATKAEVTFTVNGEEKTVTSNACATMINVVTPPIYRCDSLTAQSFGNRRFEYTLNYTAQNGAILRDIKYDFGDNTPVVVTKDTKVQHTYAQDGQYTTRATLSFTAIVDNKEVVYENVTSAGCAVTIVAETPKDNCPYPGKTHLPKNSPECKQVPTELPNTGAGGIVGVFAAVSVLAAAAYHFVAGRRFES